MTAFARASTTAFMGRFVVEIQSVNRKFLEIHTHLPKQFISFDSEIKKKLANTIGRGQINLVLSVQFNDNFIPQSIQPNIAMAKSIKLAWDAIITSVDIKDAERGLELLLVREPSLFLHDNELKNRSKIFEIIQKCITETLEKFDKMRKTEGAYLEKEIINRINSIKLFVEDIEKNTSDATEKLKEKLTKRLEEVLPDNGENEERLLREIVIYAERCDITEEITRLNSHVDQFINLIKDEDSHIGKTLDFLIKEMHRELQTIVVKASDNAISSLVIKAKSELEKIKEQIQNVE